MACFWIVCKQNHTGCTLWCLFSFVSGFFPQVLFARFTHLTVCRCSLYPFFPLFWISPPLSYWLLYLCNVQLDVLSTVILGLCFLHYLTLWPRMPFSNSLILQQLLPKVRCNPHWSHCWEKSFCLHHLHCFCQHTTLNTNSQKFTVISCQI